MTAPRDPIEAPATETHAATLRRWLLNEDDANGDRHHFRVRELDAALAAARDEGRREAVRLLADLRSMYEKANAEYEVGIGLREIREFIEKWEARHGRSSDPEPAPCCLSCLAADETCERPECLCHAGAVPALQATGEPTDEWDALDRALLMCYGKPQGTNATAILRWLAQDGYVVVPAEAAQGAAPRAEEPPHPTWDCVDCSHEWWSHQKGGCGILGCRCTERNPYAAPRAEGLDMIRLARAMDQAGIRDAGMFADRVAAEYARLSRPSND